MVIPWNTEAHSSRKILRTPGNARDRAKEQKILAENSGLNRGDGGRGKGETCISQASSKKKRRERAVLLQQTTPFLKKKNKEISGHPKHGNITVLVLRGKVSMYQNCSFDFSLLLL